MSLRIFVTTDNHVGYNELDPIRGDDAAISFNEAMSIARDADVDLVVQGGDLFHVNKPSKRSMYSVMKTLRDTCLGDKPVGFQVLNHGPLALPGAEETDHPNFADPNFNVGLPVFAISGNHDDAGGTAATKMMSPLDVLSMAGLINHFGRVPNSDDIVVTPILIEKEGIRVALYGLASVRDERLYRTFRESKVKFLRPNEDPDSWYNILVVHQNHSAHGPTNFLPERFLPNFMNLVIWGHEHECIIDPLLNTHKNFLVMQPGSTVATSLSDSEKGHKHVAVLSIGRNKSFTYEKIPLKTVRPFAMRSVSLGVDARHISPESKESRAQITEWLMGQVDELIDEATGDWRSYHDESEQPPLPLIRLRVEYSGGYEVENSTRFSNRFVNRVANTTDIIHYFKKREANPRLGPRLSSSSSDITPSTEMNNASQVGELLSAIVTSENLEILLEKKMGEALSKFVDKDEKLALKDGVDTMVKSKIDELLNGVSGLSVDEVETPVIAAERQPTPEASSPSTSRRSHSQKRANTGTQVSRKKMRGRIAEPVAEKNSVGHREASPMSLQRYATTRKGPEEDHPGEMEIDDSADDTAHINEHEQSDQLPLQRTITNRRERAARSTRFAFEPSAEPSPAADFGDDSDEMFSPDE